MSPGRSFQATRRSESPRSPTPSAARSAASRRAMRGGGRASASRTSASSTSTCAFSPTTSSASSSSDPSAMGQHQQSTPKYSANRVEEVTVTLPVHPLCGSRLSVVRRIRDSRGHRYIDVRHPQGHVVRLPVDFTDVVPVVQMPQRGGREPRASVAGLLALAAAVRAAPGDGRKLDRQTPKEPPWSESERMNQPEDVSEPSGQPSRRALAAATRGSATGRARRVGYSGPQDVTPVGNGTRGRER